MNNSIFDSILQLQATIERMKALYESPAKLAIEQAMYAREHAVDSTTMALIKQSQEESKRMKALYGSSAKLAMEQAMHAREHAVGSATMALIKQSQEESKRFKALLEPSSKMVIEQASYASEHPVNQATFRSIKQMHEESERIKALSLSPLEGYAKILNQIKIQAKLFEHKIGNSIEHFSDCISEKQKQLKEFTDAFSSKVDYLIGNSGVYESDNLDANLDDACDELVKLCLPYPVCGHVVNNKQSTDKFWDGIQQWVTKWRKKLSYGTRIFLFFWFSATLSSQIVPQTNSYILTNFILPNLKTESWTKTDSSFNEKTGMAPVENGFYIVTKRTRVRTYGNNKSKVVEKLGTGSKVWVIQRGKKWLKIGYICSKTGECKNGYIRIPNDN